MRDIRTVSVLLTTDLANAFARGARVVYCVQDGFLYYGSGVSYSAIANSPLVLENRTSDPVSPAVGQIWLRTNL